MDFFGLVQLLSVFFNMIDLRLCIGCLHYLVFYNDAGGQLQLLLMFVSRLLDAVVCAVISKVKQHNEFAYLCGKYGSIYT